MKIHFFSKIIVLISCFCLTACVSTKILDNNSAMEKLSQEIVQSMVKQKQMALAVSDFPDIDGNLRKYSVYISEELLTHLFKTKRVTVIERKRMEDILEEQQLSVSDLFDSSKVVNIGKLAGADAIVVGSLTKVNNHIRINARILDTETAEVLSVASVSVLCDEFVLPLWNSTITEDSLSADVVTIKDPNLEKAIRENIKKPDGVLRAGDLERVMRIHARDSMIYSLNGIENCINLTELDLDNWDWIDNSADNNNIIRDISPVTSLKYLEKLRIVGCKIDNDPEKLKSIFLKLDNLKHLDISNNHIRNIDCLLSLRQLEFLFICGTPHLKGYEKLRDFPNLRNLGVSASIQKEDLPVLRTLTHLEALSISVSNLESLDFLKGFTQLSYLDLNYNRIKDISLLLEIHKKGAFPPGSTLLITNCAMDLRPGSSNRDIVDRFLKAGIKVEYEDGNIL